MKFLKWVIFKEKNFDERLEKYVQREINFRRLEFLWKNFPPILFGLAIYFLFKKI